ncbi:uncharacterized protein LOC111665536 [Seriola lalandi dorsalis]|uniref:uncharacterized protein LOC111665536 n=1 Tax=Seriola lalandi dorsalis TaxID=1841481 RepID=UPI000C6F8397|nr:uncharacterized protein LOC111665536 [Seriola lalandi dorsalis]
MGHQNTEMDAESLQKVGRRRGGCLDVFLVMSVIFLFVAVAAVAVGGVMVVRDLQSELSSVRAIGPKLSGLTGNTPDSNYKMQNFAYLDATSSKLTNSTMQWDSVRFGPGQSVGSNFVFDKAHHSLKPKRAGVYFMYIELNFTCTFQCSPGLIRVEVGDKLTCDVKLPAVANSTPVSKKCWTVSKLPDSPKLITQMTVPKGLQHWKLELTGSGLGMFLVE